MSLLAFTIAERPGADVPAQAEDAFATVAAALDGSGLTLADVLKMRLFYDERHDFPAMNSVRDPLFRATFADGAFPAATGVCTGGHGEPGAARFSLEVIAAPGKRAAVSPAVVSKFGDVVPPFTHVNEAAGVAFLAGQGAFDVGGTFAGTDPADEARRSLATFPPVLAEVGRTVEDIVAMTVYLTPAASAAGPRAAVADVLEEFLSAFAVRPVVSIIPVADLAFEGMTVEIEAIAAAPGTARRTASSGEAVRAGSVVVASVTAPDLVAASARLAAAVEEVGGGLAPGALLTVWYPRADGRAALRAATGPIAGVEAPQITYAPFPASAEAAEVTVELLANANADGAPVQ